MLDALNENEYRLVPRYDEKIYILRYILMSSLGVELEETKNFEILAWDFYEETKDLTHVHIKVCSKNHGDYEIRIRIFNQASRYTLDYYTINGQYKLLSWYY